MDWTRIPDKGRRLIGIDWNDADAWRSKPIDPYLIWLDVVGDYSIGAQRFQAEYGGALSVLVELEQPFAGGISGLEVPGIYLQPLRNKATSRFVSGRVKPKALAALLRLTEVRRVQLELTKIRNTDPEWTGRAASKKGGGEDLATWIGVIDVGCPFAHDQYRDRTDEGIARSRVRYIWDQGLGRVADAPWRTTKGLGYGAELGPGQIDSAMKHLPNEPRCYVQAGMQDVVDQRVQHGYGVLELAAGRVSPLVAGPPLLGDPKECTLPIAFVQLESIAERDTSISSLGVAVLDGLRWMIDRVEQHREAGAGKLPNGAGTKLVVNLSYGGLAGPHDGTSVLESAIDELIETRGNLIVVLSAGNSYDDECKLHAEHDVPAHEIRHLYWELQEDDPTDGFLEIWFDRDQNVDAVEIMVTPPSGTPGTMKVNSSWVLLGQATGRPLAGCFFRQQVANGAGSAMCLVAIGSTAILSDAAPAGVWTVTIKNKSAAAVHLHAWIERDDYVSGNLKRKQQSWLVDPGDKSVTSTYGLNSLAHGKHTVVVGGYCLSDGMAAEDTASGPSRPDEKGSRRRGPDLAAPSDETRSLRGLLVAGATTGAFNRLSGTSAAAPSVTRQVAGWCASTRGDVSMDHVRAAIRGLPSPRFEDRERIGSAFLEPSLMLNQGSEG